MEGRASGQSTTPIRKRPDGRRTSYFRCSDSYIRCYRHALPAFWGSIRSWPVPFAVTTAAVAAAAATAQRRIRNPTHHVCIGVGLLDSFGEGDEQCHLETTVCTV